jgi:hypothetical protein
VLVVTPAGANAAAPPADAPGGEVLALFSVSMESDSPYLPLNVLDLVWRAGVAEALAATPSGGAATAIQRAGGRIGGVSPEPETVDGDRATEPAAVEADGGTVGEREGALTPSIYDGG